MIFDFGICFFWCCPWCFVLFGPLVGVYDVYMFGWVVFGYFYFVWDGYFI